VAGIGAVSGGGALSTDAADKLSQLGWGKTGDGFFVEGQLFERLLFHIGTSLLAEEVYH
jgi:hypothetical protein